MVYSGRVYFREGSQMLMIATLNKFVEGAWFPFMVAVVMTTFMSFWRWGMAKKRAYEFDRRVRLRELLHRDGEVPFKGPEGAFILGDGNQFPREKADAFGIDRSPFRTWCHQVIDFRRLNSYYSCAIF